MCAASCDVNVRNLRFRSAGEGSHGGIKGINGQIKVKFSAPQVVRLGVKYEVWCHPAASNMTSKNNAVELSMHTLHPMCKKHVFSRFNPIRENMKSNDGKHFEFQLETHWIVTGNRKLQKSMLSKHEAYCQKLGVPNNTTLPTAENRKRLCLAFTVYEYDTNTRQRIQAAPTVFSNYIYDCSMLDIKAFIQDADSHLMVMLSDTIQDYQMRMWHVNKQDNNKTCWKVDDMQCLQKEDIIYGNRNPKLKLRKAVNMLIYKAPEFNCPIHGHEDGPFDVFVQVYHGNIETDPLKVAYHRNIH